MPFRIDDHHGRFKWTPGTIAHEAGRQQTLGFFYSKAFRGPSARRGMNEQSLASCLGQG